MSIPRILAAVLIAFPMMLGGYLLRVEFVGRVHDVTIAPGEQWRTTLRPQLWRPDAVRVSAEVPAGAEDATIIVRCVGTSTEGRLARPDAMRAAAGGVDVWRLTLEPGWCPVVAVEHRFVEPLEVTLQARSIDPRGRPGSYDLFFEQIFAFLLILAGPFLWLVLRLATGSATRRATYRALVDEE